MNYKACVQVCDANLVYRLRYDSVAFLLLIYEAIVHKRIGHGSLTV